ncbi:hypothetical protein JHK82_022609 [Glycine max]|nr:hypothetical protein JHK85_023099 [Glycine max]KAG5137878.1 hypothetical protein JHK82_022609 [Glycine max]
MRHWNRRETLETLDCAKQGKEESNFKLLRISRCHGAILEGSQSHAIHAMFEELTDVDFVKIDVNELPFPMMSTFVLVKKGKEVDKVVGAKKDELERRVRNMIAILVL